ncbi:hypothetical protein VD0002_g5807 [Verticillium dahliae]|uniref:Uncharacterized protein n=1 Tax=Verticillium dahliae TaxID=27337 RepID=A0AA44WKX3_VERDA|nr:GTP-binding protein rho1 [Verticillium dahliae VDG2]KAH6710467.1 hypothetical protein EV126DRAFT_476500 [Verticillium dahliae]PNH33346.1 hypothetical protein BJF96_g3481 [Verticillium dahliae]PNH49912.1 hypothetical protein VD0003_g7254 [Verticillium dahliae]PNH62179.1 hypothetical protein VD0002_g5807 [Verticillium dahliae]
MEGNDLDPTSISNEPAPLRVIKRQSRRIRGSDSTSEYGSMRSRRTSGQTEESTGSAPGLSGWDRPLTVRKKRQSVFSPSYSPSPSIQALRPERSYMMLPRMRERNSSNIHSNGDTPSLKYPSPIKEMPDSVLPDRMDGYRSPALHSSYDKHGSVSQSPYPMDYSNAYHAPIYQDAYVLVPHISITPEARTWDNSGDVLWTAIEITGQVRQSSNSQPAFSQHAGCEGIAIPDPFRYGLLFDIRINIQPLIGAFIIELLQDDPIPTHVTLL